MIHERKEDAGTDRATGLWSIGAGITLGWDSETGGSAYFDEDWDYQGYTVRQEFYGGAGGARVYSGYEWGFDGMEGRGAYGGASALGANVEFAQNGGLSYGGSYTQNVWTQENNADGRLIFAESENDCPDCPQKPAGSFSADNALQEAVSSFITYNEGNPNKATESWQAYKRNNFLISWYTGKSVSLIDGGYGDGPGESDIVFSGSHAIVIHSHRFADYPSGQDYIAAANLWRKQRSSSYVLSPGSKAVYYVPPYQRDPGAKSRYLKWSINAN